MRHQKYAGLQPASPKSPLARKEVAAGDNVEFDPGNSLGEPATQIADPYNKTTAPTPNSFLEAQTGIGYIIVCKCLRRSRIF
jgi:hypothetical protein